MLHELETVAVEIPANLQYLNILGACVRTLLASVENLSEPETTAYNLELAVQEIGVNIIKHAYAGRIGRIQAVFLLSEAPIQVSMTLCDTGVSFNPDDVPEPQLGEIQEHGFGLFLVKQLMDQVEYRRVECRNYWKLVKNCVTIQTR